MKSKYKNVYWQAEISKWVAKVKVNYKSNHLGCFDTEDLANLEVLKFKAAHNMVAADGHIPPLDDAFEYRNGALHAKYAASYIKVGDQVGCICKTHGYVMLGHGGKLYRAHHIVWSMFKGSIPKGMEIDHINGNRADNRFENLRCVSKTENMRNRAIPVNNTSGEIGVQRRPNGKYQVCISGKTVGTFASFDDAVIARRSAAIARGFHQNHGRTAS